MVKINAPKNTTLVFLLSAWWQGLIFGRQVGLRACNAISPSADEKSRAAELELVAVAAMMITMFHLSGWGALTKMQAHLAWEIFGVTSLTFRMTSR